MWKKLHNSLETELKSSEKKVLKGANLGPCFFLEVTSDTPPQLFSPIACR